jgi:hypothetical protein
MKLITLVLALVSVSSTLAVDPRAVHISVDVSEKSQVNEPSIQEDLKSTCIGTPPFIRREPWDFIATFNDLWLAGMRTGEFSWAVSVPCAKIRIPGACSMTGAWKEYDFTDNTLRIQFRMYIRDFMANGYKTARCYLSKPGYTAIYFEYGISGQALMGTGITEQEDIRVEV